MSTPAPGTTDGPPTRDPGTQLVKAVIVTLVAVVIAILVLHHHSTDSAAATPHTATTVKGHATTTVPIIGSTTTTTAPTVSPSAIRLQVLNGLLTGNLAGDLSTKLHASPGYNTLAPDNATAKVAASQIYIVTAGYLPEARALAATLGLSPASIVATVPPPSTAPIPAADLTRADLVLVIGPDLVAKAT